MRMIHKGGYPVFVLSRAFLVVREPDGESVRLVGTHVDITEQKHAKIFDDNNARILEMVATEHPAPKIYDAIALMYEGRHPGMRCSMLELHGDKLMYGGCINPTSGPGEEYNTLSNPTSLKPLFQVGILKIAFTGDPVCLFSGGEIIGEFQPDWDQR